MSKFSACAAVMFSAALSWASCATKTSAATAEKNSARTAVLQPAGMAGALIAKYHMQTVPQEGVWFALSYLSGDALSGAALPARYQGREHAAGNAILMVVTTRDFSALHRLRTDEVWHFYSGAPLELTLLYPDGTGKTVVLGGDVLHDQVRQFTVPHDVWMGAAPRGSGAAYSFAATDLSPAYLDADFEIGYRDSLTKRYPAFAAKIAKLTRPQFASAPPAGNPPAAAPPSAATARVFAADEVASMAPRAGMELQELVGRASKLAASSAVSIAKFTLRDGASSGRSLNRSAEETLLVIGGSGSVIIRDATYPLRDKSVVYIPAGEPHEIVADDYNILEFYAISAPAFSVEDYVLLDR